MALIAPKALKNAKPNARDDLFDDSSWSANPSAPDPIFAALYTARAQTILQPYSCFVS
jgi:hypothetical protein